MKDSYSFDLDRSGRLRNQPLPDEGPVALLNWATGVRERYDRLLFRTLGRLSVIAEETEATLQQLLAQRKSES